MGEGRNTTWRQRALAAATTGALLLMGVNGLVQAINTATDYGCRRGWWDGGCAPPPVGGRR